MYNTILTKYQFLVLIPTSERPASIWCRYKEAGLACWWRWGWISHVQARSEGGSDVVRLLGLEANLRGSAGDRLDNVGGLGGGDEGGGRVLHHVLLERGARGWRSRQWGTVHRIWRSVERVHWVVVT